MDPPPTRRLWPQPVAKAFAGALVDNRGDPGIAVTEQVVADRLFRAA
jgi:hypothetical protein